MNEWKDYTLGDVIYIHDNKRIPLSTMQREQRQGNFRYYGAQGVIDYIDDYIFDGNYLLVAEDGENLKSRQSNIAIQVSGKFWVNNHAHIITTNELSVQKFIYYILNYIDLEQYITGSAQPKLNQEMLKSISISLPELPEQKAIAEILSSLDDKIELLNRQNKTLEDLAQTYFRQWFIEGEYEEFIAVSDIAILDNEGINPSKKPLELFYHYSIPAFDNDQQPIQEMGKTILSNKFKVKPKTILVSKLNPATPRIWIIGNNVLENSVCSTEFQVLKPSDDKYQLFLYFLMKSYNVVSYFSMCTTGTSGSHQRIKPEYLLQVEIGKPNEQKLQAYNDIFDDVMLKVQENMKQIQILQKLRDTLLPKLVGGEVRVKGA